MIARTSVMKYKGTEKSVAEIGEELAVGTVLEGSVRKASDEVRITTQLVDVASEAHPWAESYDRQLSAIFTIQSAIAQEVANVLKVKLLEPEKARIETSGTSNAEAYNLYLKALFLYEQGSTENFLASLEVLKQAGDLDPQFAAAYAALADFSNSLRWFTDTPAAEAHRQAKIYAEKAIALDDTVARAYVALADARMSGDFDWEGAGAAFRRAIELEPSLARAHQRYGHFYLGVLTRQVDEALAEVTRAVALQHSRRRSS